jgi:hypothetical protein
MMKIKNLLLVAILVISAKGVNAQDREWGGFLGLSTYNGDLAQSPIPLRGTRPALGAFYRYNFNSRWALKTGFTFGYIASYDRYSGKGSDREFRNLSFYSPLAELSMVVEYNFMKYVAGSRRYRSTPYVFAGLAGFYFSPHTYLSGNRVALRNLKTEQDKVDGTYSPIQLAIPVGIGYKISMGGKKLWNLGVELGFRKTFTDYLDDVSGSAPTNTGSLTPQEQALAYRGTKGWPRKWARGNPDKKDSYLFFGITLSKTIRKFECRF